MTRAADVSKVENGDVEAVACVAATANKEGGDDGAADNDHFVVANDKVDEFPYDHKEAICLDLSRAAGVTATDGMDVSPLDSIAGAPREGVGRVTKAQTSHDSSSTNNNAISTQGEGKPEPRKMNVMDMSQRGMDDMRRFTEAVSANTVNTAATTTSTATAPDPSVLGLSRRKAPMTPAVRYLMEAMCTDLVACGECFVPHFLAQRTLVRFCGFVPFEVGDGLDEETRRFMEGEGPQVLLNGFNTLHGSETYGRGIGLPGLAWATARASLVEILTLTSDASFDSGGTRLAEAGKLFHTALTVPLYFTSTASNTNSSSSSARWGQQQLLMGVVVVYFRSPKKAASASGLVGYASAVAKSAAALSELMVRRARFVVGRAHRIKRNWRVLIIALRFALPMLVRYYRLTGKPVTFAAVKTTDAESGTPSTAADRSTFMAQTSEMSASCHKLNAETATRAMVVVDQADGRAVRGRCTRAWLDQYFAKAKGGRVTLMPRANPRDSVVTWFGAFAAIGSLELIYSLINESSHWGSQEDMFILSGSFGALATILFAIPGTPLAQPRVMLSAHALAMALSMLTVSVFKAGRVVWLQSSVTVASAILGMSLIKSVHPPAGALCLVLLNAHNKGATWERMLMLIASVVMGLAVHIAVGIGINNISPRRGYPAFW